MFGRNITIPYANDSIATGVQVRILGNVARPLALLAFGQRVVSRVSVPIFAISLDDQCPDPNINNELWFDQCGWFVGNAERVKDGAQAHLKFTRFVALQALLTFKQLRVHGAGLFRVVCVPVANLLNGFGLLHRVMLQHVRFGLGVNDPACRSLGQPQAHFICAIAHDFQRKAQSVSNGLRAVDCIVTAKVCDLLNSPSLAPIANRVSAIISNFTALLARSPLHTRAVREGRDVTAANATKALFRVCSGWRECTIALFARALYHCSVLLDLIITYVSNGMSRASASPYRVEAA